MSDVDQQWYYLNFHMIRKTLTAEFFTTIDWPLFVRSLVLFVTNWNRKKTTKNTKRCESLLAEYLGVSSAYIVSMYSARSALYHCLDMLQLSDADEIIVQSYTCVSVSNAILQTGARIVYADIDPITLGFDVASVEKSISLNTRAIIVQHTF